MERELRVPAPAPATGAVESVGLDEIADDDTFRVREPGDVSGLATSIGRLGQLVPIELRLRPGAGDGPRWQLLAGFRRVEALRVLKRDRVLARLHGELSDEDAWALALSQPLLGESLTAMELESLRDRLRSEGVASWADDLIDQAQLRAPIGAELRERFHAFLRRPRLVEEREAAGEESRGGRRADRDGSPGEEPIEVTPEELSQELAVRFAEVNQDLALAYDVWDELPAEGRRAIVQQARYVADLLPFLLKKTR